MEAVIGIAGKDYVLLASDMNAARSIVRMNQTENRTKNLGPSLAMAYSGEAGSATELAEYLQANMKLYLTRNDYSLGAGAAAAYSRRVVADALRTRSPFAANVLIGGFDDTGNGTSPMARLFWIDHLGTMAEMHYAAHGYSAFFVLSLLDRFHRPDMPLSEGLDLLRQCIAELKTRFLVALPQFAVKIVRLDGTEDMIITA